MSAAIGPGDWVECVRLGGPYPPGFDNRFLRVGQVYRVLSVVQTQRGDAVELEEATHITPDGWRACFYLKCFRPIYRPKAELIESLKAPPRRVGEFA